MKILYSVSGIGIGHATRSIAVANTFKRDKVLFVSFAEGYNFLKQYYDTKKINWFDMAGKFSIEVFGTFMNIMSSIDSHKESKNKMRKIISDFAPDIIISDSEIVSLGVGKEFGIPTFSISNLYSVPNNYKFIPKEFKTSFVKLQKKIVDEFNKYISSRSLVTFYPSFDKVMHHFNGVKMIDLIVRKRPKKIRNKKLIYVTVGGSDIEKPVVTSLVRSLKKIKEYEFIISGYKKNIDDGNLHLRTFIDPFVVLSKVSAVITTAGHSSISEALVYKKPILALPIYNHVEQLANAYSIKNIGVGDVLIMKDLRLDYSDEIKKFIDLIPKFMDNIRELHFKGFGAEEIHDYISRSI